MVQHGLAAGGKQAFPHIMDKNESKLLYNLILGLSLWLIRSLVRDSHRPKITCLVYMNELNKVKDLIFQAALSIQRLHQYTLLGM